MSTEPSPAEMGAIEAEDVRRGVARNRNASLTVRADLAGKAISIAVRLISIPVSLQLLGAERYGLWLTLSSVLMWLNLSQFGLGGGLLNEIGKASATDDRELIRRHISTAYFLFGAIGLVVFALIVVLSASSVAPLILGVAQAPHLAGEARGVFILAGALFALSLVTNAVGSICMGLQEGFLSYGSYALGSLLSLVSLGVVFASGANSLWSFAIAMGAPVLVTNSLLTIYLFYYRHPTLRPRWSDFGRENLNALASMSGALGVIQLAELTVLHSANPLIANYIGLSEVSKYGVPMSFFMMVATICQGFTSAYLAAFCEASVRQDWPWIRSTFARSSRRALILILVFAIGMTALGPTVIGIWTRGKVTPEASLLAVMSGYFILMVVSAQYGVLLVGLGKAYQKAVLQVFVAIIHVAGFFILAPRLGIFAVPIAGSLAYAIDVLFSRYLAKNSMAGEPA